MSYFNQLEKQWNNKGLILCIFLIMKKIAKPLYNCVKFSRIYSDLVKNYKIIEASCQWFIYTKWKFRGGKWMGEQEKYKNLLKKVIQETENQNINSSQEMVNMLVKELRSITLTSSVAPKS